MNAVDHWPMLWAAFCLLDKVTNGYSYPAALEEVCASLALNHSQRHVIDRAYRVLCGTDPFPATHHTGVSWG